MAENLKRVTVSELNKSLNKIHRHYFAFSLSEISSVSAFSTMRSGPLYMTLRLHSLSMLASSVVEPSSCDESESLCITLLGLVDVLEARSAMRSGPR